MRPSGVLGDLSVGVPLGAETDTAPDSVWRGLPSGVQKEMAGVSHSAQTVAWRPFRGPSLHRCRYCQGVVAQS